MKTVKEMSQAELAAHVQSHLREQGIEVVLSGGATVAIYSGGEYVSLDLDLVNVYFAKRRKIVEAMDGIGFSQEGRHFGHPDTGYFVEFPPGPLAIGESQVKEITEMTLETGMLRVISPTECVKDRLVQYYHWADLQCLEQACMVAAQNPIDLDEIESWSQLEGKLDAFNYIKGRLRKA